MSARKTVTRDTRPRDTDRAARDAARRRRRRKIAIDAAVRAAGSSVTR